MALWIFFVFLLYWFQLPWKLSWEYIPKYALSATLTWLPWQSTSCPGLRGQPFPNLVCTHEPFPWDIRGTGPSSSSWSPSFEKTEENHHHTATLLLCFKVGLMPHLPCAFLLYCDLNFWFQSNSKCWTAKALKKTHTYTYSIQNLDTGNKSSSVDGYGTSCQMAYQWW